MVHQPKLVTALLLLTVSVSSGFCGQKPSFSRQFSSSFSKEQCHQQQYCAPLYLSSQPNSNENTDGNAGPKKQLSRRRQWWRKSKRSISTIALALSFLRSPAAFASTTSAEMVDASARANDLFIESLRPGATNEDAKLAMDVDQVVLERTNVNTAAAKKKEDAAAAKASKKKLKSKPKKNLYYDDEDDDDLDDDLFGEAEKNQLEAAFKNSGGKSSPKTATTSDIYFKTSKTSTSSYVKATFIFITLPVLLFGGIETYKRRSESAYVKKALKIQAMKKQEHMTETEKERLAEEKKKKEEEEAEGDDDDDDEDDEDEDDEDDDGDDYDDDDDAPPKPKKPSGGDDDDGPPSADDIDRLNKLMGRG